MRIIAGEKRGAVLSAPKGLDTRPTLDRVKETLFGVLQFKIAGRRVLDLFAGSGALGLEALSRGAEYAAFCDSSRDSVAAVRANIEKLGYGAKCRIYGMDWTTAVLSMAAASERFDLVFLDPPYALGAIGAAIGALRERRLLAPECIVAIEYGVSQPPALPEGFEIYDTRRFGDTAVSLAREVRA